MYEHRNVHNGVQAAPELYDEIVRAKQRLESGATLSEAAEDTRLDARSVALILSRPTQTRAHTFVSPVRDLGPVVGTRKVLVLLVDFSDQAATETQAHFSDMLFSSGTYATGSMRDYYKEVSYNKLDVTGQVAGAGGVTAGWFRAPQPKSYYTNSNYGFGAYPRNAQRLAQDVIDLAAPHVNFANYDNDGDGFVDALVIIASGIGAEETGDVNDIWSHKWGFAPKTVDGVKIDRYFMAPENGQVGVMAHELGHLLFGWPDYYDTDYSSAGTGRWDLMAGGSWNNGGLTPAHPNGLCKVEAGWVNPTTIFNSQSNVTIKPYADNDQVYRLPVGSSGSKEYFLISNRHKTGFDSHLPGEGMIIEHVDENQANNTDENHYRVDIEQCDGNRDLNTNANRGDATDPFPSAGKDAFTANATPNSKAYDGSDPNVSVTNIQVSSNNIKADISVGAAKQWYYNKKVTLTYAYHAGQSAWAHIDGLGWRRIKEGAADGVVNIFVVCCEAVANGQDVHVYADATYIYVMYFV